MGGRGRELPGGILIIDQRKAEQIRGTLEMLDNGMELCPMCEQISDWDEDYCDNHDRMGFEDYIDDNVDVEFTVGKDGGYRSCLITLEYGGPGVYIDTAMGCVEVHWATESARTMLQKEMIERIDKHFMKIFEETIKRRCSQ